MVLWEGRYGYLIEAGKSRDLDAGPPSSRAGEYAGRNRCPLLLHLDHPAKALRYGGENHGIVLLSVSFPGGFVLTAVYTCNSGMLFPFISQRRTLSAKFAELQLPRTLVNRDKGKGRGATAPAPGLEAPFSLWADDRYGQAMGARS